MRSLETKISHIYRERNQAGDLFANQACLAEALAILSPKEIAGAKMHALSAYFVQWQKLFDTPNCLYHFKLPIRMALLCYFLSFSITNRPEGCSKAEIHICVKEIRKYACLSVFTMFFAFKSWEVGCDEKSSLKFIVPERGVEQHGNNRGAIIRSYDRLLGNCCPLATKKWGGSRESHGKCLADLCGALHCDFVMNLQSLKTKCNPAAAVRNRHLCENFSYANSVMPTLAQEQENLSLGEAGSVPVSSTWQFSTGFDVPSFILLDCIFVSKRNENPNNTAQAHLKTRTKTKALLMATVCLTLQFVSLQERRI
ncbi:hypothetical protein Sango_1726600 [Sesamum angolense]|uniref:Uncharacterized protein n=1 Tax=Sesamum angolense TaxID=2727404 RepID=A0AAE1WLD4_9LAMI|nr:hypothetical protein Sango_1726600 [Sesamum angolense]